MTPSKPPPPTNNFCLYPPPVLRCFWKDPLMTHTTPLQASFTATPSPSTTPSPLKMLIIHESACCLTRLTLENQFNRYVRTIKCYSFGQFMFLYSQRAWFPLKWRTYLASFTLLFSFYCFYFWVLFTELEHCPTHLLLSLL